MGKKARQSSFGMELSFVVGATEELSLAADPSVDQEHPQDSYVYTHQDSGGNVFYVGKGVGRRAWSLDRHPLWHRYVKKHLRGQFSVVIMKDGLSEEQAALLEAAWLRQCGNHVVNWVSLGRDFDFESNALFHRLRNANRDLIQRTRAIEKSDPEKAVRDYTQAVAAIEHYAPLRIEWEGGLVGRLLREESAEEGHWGDMEALDRLTMCLTRLGRAQEAACAVNRYFALYKRDSKLKAAERIQRRVVKALEKSAEVSR